MLRRGSSIRLHGSAWVYVPDVWRLWLAVVAAARAINARDFQINILTIPFPPLPPHTMERANAMEDWWAHIGGQPHDEELDDDNEDFYGDGTNNNGISNSDAKAGAMEAVRLGTSSR